MSDELSIVTGSAGFTGKYVTRRLLAMGKQVRSLTGHPNRSDPFGGQVPAVKLDFENPTELIRNLEGASTLYNTYWIRFPHGGMTFDKAVTNSRTLIQCAVDAGMRRVVHVGIANPSEDSDLPYYKGKALVEKTVLESGLNYAIVRPTVLFGPEDILINNIAWFLRKLPLFVVPGDGEYGIQPVYVDDFAQMLVEAGQTPENRTMDAAGPEKFTLNEMIKLIARTVGGRAIIIHLNPALALMAVKRLGMLVKDVVLTDAEVKGLLANMLISQEEPRGKVRLSDWLKQNASNVGTEYHSELARRYK